MRTPLADIENIVARQSAIAALLESPEDLPVLSDLLDDVCDIERIVARVSLSGEGFAAGIWRVCPAAWRRCPNFWIDWRSCRPARMWRRNWFRSGNSAWSKAGNIFRWRLSFPTPLAASLSEGGVIAQGFDSELDRLRQIGANSTQWLANYQAKLAQESGITSLKVGFNKVFGYYIEVTDSHRARVPVEWTRKQTVKNAERYITEELKNLETEALGAQEKSIALEQQLFEQVRQELLKHIATFAELAAGLRKARCALVAGGARAGRDGIAGPR